MGGRRGHCRACRRTRRYNRKVYTIGLSSGRPTAALLTHAFVTTAMGLMYVALPLLARPVTAVCLATTMTTTLLRLETPRLTRHFQCEQVRAGLSRRMPSGVAAGQHRRPLNGSCHERQ